MPDQLDLDFVRRARRRDPLTSHAAAAATSHNPSDYEKILWFLRLVTSYGGTCYEIAEATGLTNVQVARRMRELERRHYVEDTRTTRRSPSGHPCTVWRTTAWKDAT